jgi:beta-lactamase regulating signal transducer with metallopeptidase domain
MYMPFILATWMLGFFFFAIRLSIGIWYTDKLKAEGLPLENEWSAYIKAISLELGIRHLVALAESHSIKSPMVIGYLKPVILIPAGMLTGLTTEQLETIFVHELAHIKRHDYLINFIQSFLEAVFFFNPFVWIISNLIRKERECCCDDMVIQHHGGARAYAYALTHLAEARLSTQTFALSLASDKNQLLNRIKRIMERSAKNQSGKTRILLPAILLTGGLLCISWLGVQQEKTPQADSVTAEQDTIIDNKKGAYYSRKSIITIDENGQPHEEVVEEFEGDEELRPLMEEQIPPVPDITLFTPVLPPDVVTPPLPHLDIQGIPDSLPRIFPFSDHDSWEEMAKAFEERFEEFALRSADAEKLMKEFEEKFQSQEWSTRFDSLKISDDVLQRLEDFNGFDELEESLKRLRGIQLEKFRQMERNLENYNKEFSSYEQVLRDELIKDGYLSKKETIESLQWDDTMFKVNGRKIKDSDLKKYQEIHDKYFNAPDKVE